MKMHSARKIRQNPKPAPLTPAVAAVPAAGAAGLAAFAPWILLALLAFFVYLPALGAGFIWDDNALTDTALIKSAGGLWKIWTQPSLIPHEQHYWPLVYSSFWLEHLLAGLDPFLYHLDNILLHVACCLLLWRVLVFLSVPGAWLAAALFAVHPVHAESVAWVIERKDVLSGALYFGSALAFLSWDRGRPRPQPATGSPSASASPESPTGRRSLYILSLALFTAALLSKSIVVSLPLALALILWWRHGRLTRHDLIALGPLVLLAVGVTLADLHYIKVNLKPEFENSGLALPERVQLAGRSIWVYLAKLAWPHPLAPFYPQWRVGRSFLPAWLPLVSWLALMAALWIARKRTGRAPFAAMMFYSVTLAPVLGVMDFEFLRLSWIADRFQYLAAAGPLVLAGAGLALLARKLAWSEGVKRYAAAALLAVLGILCLRQASLYKDSLTFFRASVATCPQCWPAHTNYAWELLQAGRGDEAVQTLSEGMRLTARPEYHLAYAMAVTMDRLQRLPEAEQYYKETLRIKPDYNSGRVDYAVFLARQGRADDAVAQYREALRIRPDDVSALNNLGNTLRSQKKLAEAEECLTRALRLQPRNGQAHLNLAQVYVDQRKIPQVIEQCRQALDIDPNQEPAQFTLGQALLVQGQYRDAAVHFKEALRLQPRSLGTLFLLGQTYQSLGEARTAAYYYQESLKVQPGFPGAIQALRSLGVSIPSSPGR